MKLVLSDSKFWKQQPEFTAELQWVLKKGFRDTRKHFPQLKESLTLLVQPLAEPTLEETGENGIAYNEDLTIIWIDPALPHGADDLLRRLRGTVMHELNHVARYKSGLWASSMLDHCIVEGLGTVFERDVAGLPPAWADYDNSLIIKWTHEVIKVSAEKDDAEPIWDDSYMFEHPDGRRWIGYKVGTYIVGEAMKKSGKTIAQLTELECSEILKLAGLHA